MANNDIAYDNLCKSLEPYVASTLSSIPVKESKTELPISSLEEVFEGEELEVIQELKDALAPPNAEDLYRVRVKVTTEMIASSWSETLRWAYKEQGSVDLSESLLPQNLGRAERAWNANIGRLDLTEGQVNDILKKLGEEKNLERINLPWGGYVAQSNGRYVLEGPN